MFHKPKGFCRRSIWCSGFTLVHTLIEVPQTLQQMAEFLLPVEKWQWKGRIKVAEDAEKLFSFVSVLDFISFGKTDGSDGTNCGSVFVGNPWGSELSLQLRRWLLHSMAPVHQSVPQTSPVSPLSETVSSEAAASGRCSPMVDASVCLWQSEQAVLTQTCSAHSYFLFHLPAIRSLSQCTTRLIAVLPSMFQGGLQPQPQLFLDDTSSIYT